MEVEGISFAEKFTKTLFVRFRSSPELERLRAMLADFLGLMSVEEFDPHLSLLYAELPLREKESLARSLHFPLASVTFHGCKVISHPASISSRADVEAWRTVAA
ncbi:MAG: hypothetical protein ACR2HH_03915 [Chthoniobacterales bacterium]